ncbi:DUF4861 domain-containing protein [Parabacteroides sp. OttesenSCG-928-G21]|nr:DUF4861 domain-containing protein [Parabacteroides sp. OttesenSCG-928-G21]
MKKTAIMKKAMGFLIVFFLFSCTGSNQLTVKIENNSAIDRVSEVVEIALNPVSSRFGDSFILTDEEGQEIAWQKTYDDKLIFPATVRAGGQAVYHIKAGMPMTFRTIASGKHYPERVDDIAWENDRIAFRTYGPALQATGERAFGYDIWVKRVAEPVVAERYRKELEDGVSYHRDNGNGLDYYSVGPTLGAGTTALYPNDSIVYPYCYNTYELLDNGPLRFTVKLVYHPLEVGENRDIVETRLISLDAGSQLNRVMVSYANLREEMPIATGIVMRAPSEEYAADKNAGYIAYAESAHPANGQTFVATVFPSSVKLIEAEPVFFSETERKERGGATGHLLAVSSYTPGEQYTYYFGGGWSKWGFETSKDWFAYVADYAQRQAQPLTVTVR